MGDTIDEREEVSVSQAAYLVHHNERAIRWHIGKGHLTPRTGADGHMRLDVAALAAVRGWRVDLARLDELRAADGRTAEALDTRIRALERRVRDLEARLAGSERAPHDRRTAWEPSGAMGLPAPSDLPYSASQGHSIGLSPDARHILSDLERPRRPTVALADRGAGVALTFRTRADAARWLVRHGIANEYTPKTWGGWRDVPHEPAGVLAFALDLQRTAEATGNHRVTWRLHRCGDPACVCQDEPLPDA